MRRNHSSSEKTEFNIKKQRVEGKNDLMEKIKEALEKMIPVSHVVEPGSMECCATELNIEELIFVFDSLVKIAECIDNEKKDDYLQCALVDVTEFLAIAKDEICVQDSDKLETLRSIVGRFEDTVNNVKPRIDYRTISVFMENSLGSVVLTSAGTMVSPFNKIKSRLFRTVSLSWEQRKSTVQLLLKNIPDDRRHLFLEGRAEMRGYVDMSDQELQGWLTLCNELGIAQFQ